MVLLHFMPLIFIFIDVLTLFCDKSLSVSLRNNSLNQQNIVSTNKIKIDIYRIEQTLQPLQSLYNSRDVYRKYNNMLQTLWTCCPAQRIHMFDVRNVHQALTGRTDCRDFIQNNQNHLTTQCQKDLKLFNPTRGDLGTCDGHLLRNLADQYIFVVQLFNYTKRWCMDDLHPMLIYSNINQILPCERAIRRRLRKEPESYTTYDVLSRKILDVYVQNLNNYRDCKDSHFWNEDVGKEEIDPSLPMVEYRR